MPLYKEQEQIAPEMILPGVPQWKLAQLAVQLEKEVKKEQVAMKKGNQALLASHARLFHHEKKPVVDKHSLNNHQQQPRSSKGKRHI